MRVRATAKGFYGKLRRPGEKFEIDPKLFSTTWMAKVGAEASAEASDAEDPDGETNASLIRNLRKKFREVFGKKPAPDATAEQLQAELAQKEKA